MGSQRTESDSEDPLYSHAAGVILHFKPSPSGYDRGICYINYGLCVGLAAEAPGRIIENGLTIFVSCVRSVFFLAEFYFQIFR